VDGHQIEFAVRALVLEFAHPDNTVVATGGGWASEGVALVSESIDVQSPNIDNLFNTGVGLTLMVDPWKNGSIQADG